MQVQTEEENALIGVTTLRFLLASTETLVTAADSTTPAAIAAKEITTDSSRMETKLMKSTLT